MKHSYVVRVLCIFLVILIGAGIFQAGIWYNQLSSRSHVEDNITIPIISPNQFNTLLSLSREASFEVVDSASRKQYIMHADQTTGIVSFLEKRIEDRYYLTSWNTYRDGGVRDAVFNGTVLLYRGQGEFAGYRSDNGEKTGIYGRDLDSLISTVNEKTRKAIGLIPTD